MRLSCATQPDALSWGEDKVEEWAGQIANSWRATRDIWDGTYSKDPAEKEGGLWHLSYLE